MVQNTLAWLWASQSLGQLLLTGNQSAEETRSTNVLGRLREKGINLRDYIYGTKYKLDIFGTRGYANIALNSWAFNLSIDK